MTSSPETEASVLEASARGRCWVVLNQSQSPMFQGMMERLAERLGPCLLLTGAPHEVKPRSLVKVRAGPRYSRRGRVWRLLSWVRFELWALARLMTIRSPAFILAVSNPPMNVHLAWLVGRLRRVPFGLLIWDIYPDHAVEMGWMRETHPVVRGWRRLNRIAMRDARVIITLGASMAKTLRAKHDGLDTPVRVIPNWADTERLRPVPRSTNPFVRQHGLEDSFCVLYSGNLGASHDISTIGWAAAALREREDIKFVIVGDGLALPEMEAIVASEGLSNVLLLPSQPWERLPWSLAAGHVGLVAQGAKGDDLSVPSKTYSLMAVGSPVLAITPADSDLASLVTRHGIGDVTPPGDPEALGARIIALADDPRRVRRLSRAARATAVEHFSEDAIIRQLLDVLGAPFGRVDGP